MPKYCIPAARACGTCSFQYANHYAACPRTGLLARRAKPLERAWIRVVREAVGPEGQVVPQQWLVRAPAPGVDPDDRRRLDFVAYGATQLGEALCCDVTLVSPLTRDGRPQPCPCTPPLQCRSSKVRWDRVRIARKGRWLKKERIAHTGSIVFTRQGLP